MFNLLHFNSSDDHQFSPLHWAAKGGHTKIVEMLISRGARVHTTNMGDDTPLHLAAAHGHRDVLLMVRFTLNSTYDSMFYVYVPFLAQLLKHKSDINFVNEHGNTALHYATFWQNEECAEDLVECGALITIENKYGDTPLDKAPPRMAKRMMGE